MAAARSGCVDPRGRATRGFSLIEVLVALAILAVLTAAVVMQGAAYASLLRRLQDKTHALWVAQNTIDELGVEDAAPAPREERLVRHLAGVEWVVTRSVTHASVARLYRVEVTVGRADEPGTLIRLVGFEAQR